MACCRWSILKEKERVSLKVRLNHPKFFGNIAEQLVVQSSNSEQVYKQMKEIKKKTTLMFANATGTHNRPLTFRRAPIDRNYSSKQFE